MCEHENFECQARIGRLSTVEGGPITHYCANVTIKCTQCDDVFEFIGMPIGSSAYRPTCNMEGTEARFPITPKGQRPPEGLIGYSVTMSEVEQ